MGPDISVAETYVFVTGLSQAVGRMHKEVAQVLATQLTGLSDFMKAVSQAATCICMTAQSSQTLM